MKKLLSLLLVLLLVVTLAGCEKKTIKGKWYLDGSFLEISSNKMIAYSEDGEVLDSTDIVITDDKIIITMYDESMELDYKLSEDGQTLILSYPGDNDVYLTRTK